MADSSHNSSEQQPKHSIEEIGYANLRMLDGISKMLMMQNQMMDALVKGLGSLLELNNAQAELQAQSRPEAMNENWKQANPRVSQLCGQAASKITDLQTQYLESLANRILDIDTDGFDENFEFKELLTEEGYRLQQLGLISSVLSNLGS